jgi:hypothetical protein
MRPSPVDQTGRRAQLPRERGASHTIDAVMMDAGNQPCREEDKLPIKIPSWGWDPVHQIRSNFCRLDPVANLICDDLIFET